MKINTLLKGCVLSLLVTYGLASAHHSGAFFSDEEITIIGKVIEVQFTNPHSWLEVMVADDEGNEVQWSIELGAPIVLFRAGWTRELLKPGDEVTLVIHPMSDGRPAGGFVSMKLADGREIGGR
ncbi:MAG: DUF6152 family protein [Haliea sp.]